MEESAAPAHICSICEVPCSGYHFNCASCSACAAFFRRTVSLSKTFSCTNQGNCRVHYAMRIICRSCRYVKCLEKGMVREAVQQRRPTNYGRRKLTQTQLTPTFQIPLPRFNQSTQTEYFELDQQDIVSSSTFIDFSLPPLTPPEKPEQSFPEEVLLQQLINEEGLVNERRRFLNGQCSVSKILSSYPSDGIALEAKDLKELSFAGIQKDVRPAILCVYEWMRSWPYFPQLDPRDRKTLLRRCVLYQGILDSAYLTLRLGLPDKYILSNGMYAGIPEDSEEGWQDEPGVIKASLKKSLYRPLLSQVLDDVVYPMMEIELTHIEYIFLKSIVCYKSCSMAEISSHIKEIMLSYVNELFAALHFHYQQLEKSNDEIAERTGNIILLISSIFCLGMECFETHQKIQFFDLWQLDELLVKLISGARTM